MKSLLAFFGFLFFGSLQAQDIPNDRITDWTRAGLHESIEFANSSNIDEFESFVESNGNYSLAVAEAIKSLIAKGGGVLNFNSKEYFFTNTINIPSNIVLAGVSSSETVFRFSLGGNGACISFKGKVNGKALPLTKETELESNEIFTSSNLVPKTYAFVRYKDKSVLESSWAYNHYGQIVYCSGQKTGAQLLESSMRLAISNLDIADVLPLKPVTNSGIENFKILRTDKSSKKVSKVLFDYSTNCFMSGIESNKANYAHVDIRHSAHITVKGNYFHHAFSYGSGGVGYGVVTHFAASDNLIEDNVFEHLRHSMLVQAGANGNVFSYNYSTDPYWEQGFFPSGSAGDIVLHGNHPFLNLFEGNIAQNLVIDGSHGVNGPHNTFFRNSLENLGISAIAYPMTNSQNFAANEVTSNSFFGGLYVILGVDHLSLHNIIRGEITPIGTIEPSQISLYKTNASESERIGTKDNYNSSTLNAKERFARKEFTESITLYEFSQEKVKIKKGKRFWQRKKNK